MHSLLVATIHVPRKQSSCCDALRQTERRAATGHLYTSRIVLRGHTGVPLQLHLPSPPSSLTHIFWMCEISTNTRYDNRPLARTAHVRHLPCVYSPRLTTTSFSLYCNYAECLELTHQGNDFHHHLRIKHWGLNILVLMLVIIISQSLLLQLQSRVLSLQITFCMMLSTTQKQLFVKPVSQSVSTHSPEQWSEEMRW